MEKDTSFSFKDRKPSSNNCTSLTGHFTARLKLFIGACSLGL